MTKQLISLIAGGIDVIAFLVYIRSMMQDKKNMEPVSWLIWTCLGWFGFAMSYDGKWDPILLILLITCIFQTIVLGMALKYGAKVKFEKSDRYSLVACVASLIIWGVTGNPEIGLSVIITIDAWGGFRTCKKLWMEPWSEDLGAWVMFFISAFIGIYSAENHTFQKMGYLSYLAVMCGSAMLIIFFRKEKVARIQ